MTFPIEYDDVARAERVIAVDVQRVYRAIEAVDQWSSWVEGVVAPVKKLDDATFELSRVRDGKMTAHHVEITARGPVHSLTTEVDHNYRLQFFTRPHPSGTHVEVVSEPVDRRGWWTHRVNRRRAQRGGGQLEAMLERLASHLEHGD